MTLALLLQDRMIEGEPVDLWWVWVLIAVLCLGLVVYLVRNIKPGGGPWSMR